MRRIVAGIWSLENMTYDKLAKYMRCLFKVTLPIRGDLALQLLEEACEMAKQAIGVSMLVFLLPTKISITTLERKGEPSLPSGICSGINQVTGH